MNSNKYRRVQAALLELQSAARNEVDENLYEVINTKIIDPINKMLFMMHLAFEDGRAQGMRAKDEAPQPRRSVKTLKKATTSPKMLTQKQTI